jgi:predicted Rossmann-fold nucleotide-binding protein
MKIKNIAVFCGSKSGNDPEFVLQTIALGQLMAQEKSHWYMEVAIKALWVQ